MGHRGVHLKAARAEDGRVTKVAQYASPLRSGTERLSQAFAEAKKDLGRADRHVTTMTGELADIFSSRAEGVERLARELADFRIYAAAAAMYFTSTKQPSLANRMPKRQRGV